MGKVLLIRPSNSARDEVVETSTMLHRLPAPPFTPPLILQAVISRIFEAITHRARKALINQETLSLTTGEFIVWRVQTLNHD